MVYIHLVLDENEYQRIDIRIRTYNIANFINRVYLFGTVYQIVWYLLIRLTYLSLI